MSDWTLMDGVSYPQMYALGASTGLTAVATDAAANTKSPSAVELLAAGTPYNGLLDVIICNQAASVNFLVDILIGPAGSEVLVVENLMYHNPTTGATLHAIFPLRIAIPANTRISAKAQSVAGGQNANVGLRIWPLNWKQTPGFSAVETLGAVTADSGGTSVAGPQISGQQNSKRSWVNVGSPTTYPMKGLMIVPGTTTVARANNHRWYIDIGVGGTVLVPDIFMTFVTGVMSSNFVTVPMSIPAGTQLQVRTQCSGYGATTDLDFVLYGLR